MFDRNANLDLECLRGHKFQIRLGELMQGGVVTCPESGAEIDTAPFARDMADAETKLKNFGNSR